MLVTAHTGRKAAVDSARLVISRLVDAGVSVRVLSAEAEAVACEGPAWCPPAWPPCRTPR
nr:hypothetical protein GCM10020093_030050 [Planobispora longispora]